MNEIILSEEIKKRSQERRAKLEQLGVNKDRLDRMDATILTNELPAEGVFDAEALWHVNKADDTFSHLRMKVAGSDQTCSISCLKQLGSSGDNHQAVATGGGYRLKIEAINKPFAKLSVNDLASVLEGRKFKARKVVIKTRPFEPRVANQPAKQVTYNSPVEAVTGANTYDCYEIELLD